MFFLFGIFAQRTQELDQTSRLTVVTDDIIIKINVINVRIESYMNKIKN